MYAVQKQLFPDIEPETAIKNIADYKGFRGGPDSGSLPAAFRFYKAPADIPRKRQFPKKKYAGHPVRNVPERTYPQFCHLIISGCCALP